MASKHRNPVSLLLLIALCVLPACSGDEPHGWYSVEIAPGKFVPVSFSSWTHGGMTVQYSNQVVKWVGSLKLNPPRTLMEFEGKLYMVALKAEREKFASEWYYCFFVQEGNGFKEIPAKDFPRSVAIFNLWRPGDRSRYATGIGGVTIDYSKLGRELNPEDDHFVNSYQARLWYMLEKEISLYQAEREFGGEEGKKFLRDYIVKYKPVRLTSMEMKPVTKGKTKF